MIQIIILKCDYHMSAFKNLLKLIITVQQLTTLQRKFQIKCAFQKKPKFIFMGKCNLVKYINMRAALTNVA